MHYILTYIHIHIYTVLYSILCIFIAIYVFRVFLERQNRENRKKYTVFLQSVAEGAVSRRGWEGFLSMALLLNPVNTPAENCWITNVTQFMNVGLTFVCLYMYVCVQKSPATKLGRALSRTLGCVSSREPPHPIYPEEPERTLNLANIV